MSAEEFNADFQESFMKPQIYHGGYFEIETTCGMEVVPVSVCGEVRSVAELTDFLEGSPLYGGVTIDRCDGWLARMSAPSYMDCTGWTHHRTEDAAQQYLVNNYGGE
ncbi:hypothetical protein [Paraburkholderia fungorum]|uniref:hypothetical protein n=1 Tax=Paraburkholderia fungorum TaxID=134537 RepID=UPI0038BD17AD